MEDPAGQPASPAEPTSHRGHSAAAMWDAVSTAARKSPLRSFKKPHFVRRLRTGDTVYLGLLITAVVVTLTAFDGLRFPEQLSYDLRTRHCQWGRPAPTDRLVHLDLDDNAINDIGRWPWPRAVQAELLEEIAVAKPKAVALDIMYPEAEAPTIVKRADGTYETVDNDARFEAALRKLGCAILPFDYIQPPTDTSFRDLINRVSGNLQLTQEQLVAEVSPKARATVDNYFYDIRKIAIGRRVHALLRTENLSLPQTIRDVMKPATRPAGAATQASTSESIEGPADPRATNALIETGPLEKLITAAWEFEQARKVIVPHHITAPGAVLTDLDNRELQLLPITRLAAAAADTAFVTYNKDGDGKMRRLPLVANLDGVGASVSLGLALALRMLDVPLSAVTLTPDKLIIPKDGRAIEIPIRTLQFEALARPTAGNMDLPWFGPPGLDTWLRMYDSSDGTKHTISMARVWQSITLRKRIARNNERLRAACLSLVTGTIDRADQEPLEKRRYDPYDANAWIPQAQDLLKASEEDFVALQANPPKPNQEVEYRIYSGVIAARPLIAELTQLGKEAEAVRTELAAAFNNRALLIGWTATGRTDFITTPLHPAAAGVRIHGVVFNAVMTNKFITVAPLWLTLLLTASLGIIGTWSVVRLQPLEAFLLSVLLAVLYLGVAAALFGPYAYVLGVAGPLTAIAATYLFGSLIKFLRDRAERIRIQRRFSNYVDPQLVNYVLANPDKVGLEGERRLMTVCFTDLEGFTKISERLGEETVGLLNKYFAVMVPLIRKHEGHLNKFLGDGIMFFFNAAPKPKERHAAAAFDAVLDMQAALTDFNAELVTLKLPSVKMRIGITTGEMIAGDAGGGGASDYTVLGDVVNLSSRLEGANKASGTLILCNRPAADHAGPGYLTRPIGTLKVVGKSQGVETFEVMSTVAAASVAMKTIAEVSTRMVNAYRAKQFDTCLSLANELAAIGDTSKLSKLYRGLCADHADNADQPLASDFDGSITLDSK